MGEQFGNYEILRRIAAGGMAEVFLAKQTGLGGFERLVCIKRILPHLGEQEDFVKMFQDEARIAANLIHPNVAQIYDIGQVSGAYYIAMEYVRGEDLRRIYNQEVARGRAMPPEPAAQIILGAAAGLDYAHRQTTIDGRPLNIVHRDVSPQNILVTYDGHVKLVDFGVAKAAGKMTETRTGVLKGKYSYMSPEQASGDPIDARTDIFALGITLYEVTTGVRLFKRDNEIETLHAVIECNVAAPGEVLPGYDPDLETIVMKALSFDPDARFQSAGEMTQALERMLIGRGHATGASSLGAYMQDLFAEKLADELLFGGQVWDERLTPIRNPSGNQGPAEDRTAALEPPSEDTIVEKSEGAAEEHERKDEQAAPARAGDDWATSSEPASWSSGTGSGRSARARSGRSGRDGWGGSSASAVQTATHGAPASVRPLTLTPSAPGFVARHPRPAWIGWAIAATIVLVLAAGGLAVALTVDRGVSLPRSGEVVIESEPRGARVVFLGPGSDELNERYDAKGFRTPFTVSEGLPVGAPIRARFLKDGFDVVERNVPTVRAGVLPEPLFAELKLADAAGQTGALILLSSPAGADIYIDGNKLEGKTPQNDVRVRGGEQHQVELRLAGHTPRSEVTYVEPGSRRFIELQLIPDGTTTSVPEEPAPAPKATGGDAEVAGRAFLSITSALKLRVSVGGRFVGETPIRKLPIESGVQKLKLESESEGFTLRKKVRLVAGRTETIDVQPEKGFLSLNATPWAWVRLGQMSPSETPLRMQVYEGDYDVVFECPDGKKKVESAHVAPRETAAVTVSCRD